MRFGSLDREKRVLGFEMYKNSLVLHVAFGVVVKSAGFLLGVVGSNPTRESEKKNDKLLRQKKNIFLKKKKKKKEKRTTKMLEILRRPRKHQK